MTHDDYASWMRDIAVRVYYSSSRTSPFRSRGLLLIEAMREALWPFSFRRSR